MNARKRFTPAWERLRLWRNYRHLTQSELEGRAGLSHNALSRIETGSVEPRLDTLERIAAALEIALEELQFRDPPLTSTDLVATDGEASRVLNRLDRLSPERRRAVLQALEILLDQMNG